MQCSIRWPSRQARQLCPLSRGWPAQVFQTPGEDEPLAAGTAARPEVLAETLLQRRRVLTRAALELAIMGSLSHPNIVQVR